MTPVGEGSGTEVPSPTGHTCICGQPLEEDLRDMTVFAGETSIAYVVCLFERLR